MDIYTKEIAFVEIDAILSLMKYWAIPIIIYKIISSFCYYIIEFIYPFYNYFIRFPKA